jgi:hypothetical protein
MASPISKHWMLLLLLVACRQQMHCRIVLPARSTAVGSVTAAAVDSGSPETLLGLRLKFCHVRWSALSRHERYRTRCGADGAPEVDASNPLPERVDPITLEPVVSPAISPYGHVMGAATWKVGSVSLLPFSAAFNPYRRSPRPCSNMATWKLRLTPATGTTATTHT